MTTPTDPQPLPEALQTEAPTTKLLFVWLGPQGTVTYTVRELGLLTDIKPASGSAPGRYRVKR